MQKKLKSEKNNAESIKEKIAKRKKRSDERKKRKAKFSQNARRRKWLNDRNKADNFRNMKTP